MLTLLTTGHRLMILTALFLSRTQTIMLMVMGTTFVYEMVAYIYHIFRLGILFEPYSFLKIALIEVLYNAIIVIIVYPIIQKAGYAIENTFKVKNILTRYF